MRFCLIRKAAAGASNASSADRSVTLLTRKLTIGRGPNQHLQLTAPGVDDQHAVITATSLSGLKIACLSGRGLGVNGRRETRANLKPGDLIQIGLAKLIVHPARSRRTVILEVDEPPQASDEGEHERSDHSAPEPRMSPWSWGLSLSFALLFLLLPLCGLVMPGVQNPLRNTPLLPSDALWSPGPLHTAHQSIGNRCDACHVEPFEPVRDKECLVCHGTVQHHVDIRTADVSLFEGTQCTACHVEHKQPATLVEHDPRVCTDCHGDLSRHKPNTKLRDVTDFGNNHPEFKLTVLASQGLMTPWKTTRIDRDDPAHFAEHSHLRFSHQQHLDPKGIKSPTGERILGCQDCHKPNASGREMIPIKMETHCSGCHSLLFDEHDPTSGVPHGDLEGVYKTLREHFSREYLAQSGSVGLDNGRARRPGGEQRVMSQAEQLRARDWVDTQSLKIARELLEKRVCVDCHEVTHMPEKAGLDQWRVEPVQLTSEFMPRARFDHAAHISETCVSCHARAPESKKASDILVPGITRCRECHGGTDTSAKVASDCLMCHPFHIPNRGLWVRTADNAGQAAR